jgi:hypothetical protein
MMDRVWCFQERVLASHTVHFALHQLYWECEEGLFWESWAAKESINRYAEYSIKTIGNSIAKSITYKETNLKVWHDRKAWFDVVQEYTSRNLTYQSDKLPALSGIVAAVQQATGDVCYAGIWRSWFLQGLLWRFQNPELDVYVSAPKAVQRIVPWRAPSWSFAALEGVVMYDHYDSYRTLCAELEECSVVPKGSNPLGELKSGSARIKGPLTTIISIEHIPTINGRACKIRLRDQKFQKATVHLDLEYYDSCEAVMITPYVGLAVTPTLSDENRYVRVGIVTVHRDDHERDHNGMVVFGPSFTASDWPAPSTVVLL